MTLNDLAKTDRRDAKDLRSAVGRKPKRTVANRAARTVGELRNTFEELVHVLQRIRSDVHVVELVAVQSSGRGAREISATFISEKLVGIKPDDKTTIIGDPIGREALLQELQVRDDPVHARGTDPDRQQGI